MPGRVRSPRDERGAVAVEMALITPILVMFVFGIIQFGIVFAQKLALSNAAREAARAGVVCPSTTRPSSTCQEIADQIENTAGTVGLNTANITVTILLKDDPTAASGRSVCAGNTEAA